MEQAKKKIIRKVKPAAAMPRLERVAAYCRVSSGKDAMLHSLSAQVSHYSELIQRRPGWAYAGVYAEMCPPTMIQMHPPCTPDAP